MRLAQNQVWYPENPEDAVEWYAERFDPNGYDSEDLQEANGHPEVRALIVSEMLAHIRHNVDSFELAELETYSPYSIEEVVSIYAEAQQ